MLFIKHIKKNFKTYLLFGYAFLLVVHFFIKDNLFPLSILFYATPIPILLGFGLILLIIVRKQKWFRLAILTCVISLGIHWMQCYYLTSEKIDSNEEHSKVLYWNLAKRDRLPVAYISNQVETHQPEILAFVEAPHTILKNLDSLKLTLPNYDFKILMGAMLVASTGDIEYTKNEFLKDRYKINLLKITTQKSTYNLIITDLTASIPINKKEPIDFLLQCAKTHNVDLIVGDFNTPFESVHFNAYTNDYYSFHHYNNGFTATWPLGMPLLEIDHIWLSKLHQPKHLYKYYSKHSDHALLVSEFK